MHRASCRFMPLCGITETLSDVESVRGVHYKEVFGDLSKVEESDANPEVLYERIEKDGKPVPPVYMAIGTDDFLYENNQIMRKFLEDKGAKMKYEEGPGIHDWNFWNAYIGKGVEWVLENA